VGESHPGPDLRAGESLELLPALADLPGHLLWRAHARVSLALADAGPDAVDLSVWAGLLALDDHTRSQQELADDLALSRTTMARTAADLVTAGLVERVRNPADRRSWALTRTSAGAEAAAGWTERVAALEAGLTPGFTAADRAELADLLLALLVSQDPAVSLPAPLRASLAFLAVRSHVLMHRTFSDALAPIGLEPRLFGALTALAATGPVPQHELGRALGTSSVSVVAMTDAMERHGLVERRRDPADRRTSLLHLTDRAPAVHAQAGRLAAASLDPHLTALGGAGQGRLTELLRRFATGG